MSGAPRDTGRQAFYDAEQMVMRMFDRAGGGRVVELAETSLTLPVEVRFASADSVRDYVDRVLSMPSVRTRFDRARVPVGVRERRGASRAHYAVGAGVEPEIAIPTSNKGRWALRELVVLHEIAHHLDDSGDAPHGRGFVTALIDLVELVLGPEVGFVYRVVFAESGVLR